MNNTYDPTMTSSQSISHRIASARAVMEANNDSSFSDATTPIQYNSPFHAIKEKLSYYIKIGDLENIKSMFALHSKDQIDSSWKFNNFDYVSPIHEAAEAGQNEVLQWLLSPAIAFDINEVTSVRFLSVIP